MTAATPSKPTVVNPPEDDELTKQLKAAIAGNLQVAVIYDPTKTENKSNSLNAILRGGSNMPVPAYPLTLALPPEKTEDSQIAYEVRHIKLVPGTNLGVSPADLMKCKDVAITAAQFTGGVLQVVLPATGLVKGEDQGYHSFSDQDAIKLIGMTMHEDWVSKWAGLLTDSRIAIVNAASNQAAELIRIKKERAAQ